jgi:hypothetical protein
MVANPVEKPGQHKQETHRHRAIPYVALGIGTCILSGGLYLHGLQIGEEEATETRIVGRTVDGYLAENDTFKNRKFLEVIANRNAFRFIVTTPDLTYGCEGSYKYDEGRVYINEQKIVCAPIENVSDLPEAPQPA